jgi:hypothetical protein
MSFENSKQHSYWGLNALATRIGARVGGFWGWLIGRVVAYVFNYATKFGVYYVNVGLGKIETNMNKETWEKVATNSWEIKDQIDAGEITISKEELSKYSQSFRSAFRKHAIYGRLSNSQTQ